MSHTPAKCATLIRQRETEIKRLRSLAPSGNPTRRKNVINRLLRELKCLYAGAHLSNWHNYQLDAGERYVI